MGGGRRLKLGTKTEIRGGRVMGVGKRKFPKNVSLLVMSPFMNKDIRPVLDLHIVIKLREIHALWIIYDLLSVALGQDVLRNVEMSCSICCTCFLVRGSPPFLYVDPMTI
jgi:hypothetical protein